ncbi:hypothetical protein BSAF29S_02982 [Bacillus safensis subsp. safensis]
MPLIYLQKLELFITKRTPESIQLLVVAPITLLVIGFLSFIVIGPVTFAIGNVLTSGLVAVFQQFAALGGLLYGGLYAALVITGMHHTFLAVDIQLINSKLHGTFLWPNACTVQYRTRISCTGNDVCLKR